MTPYEIIILIHYHTRRDSIDPYVADTELRKNTLSEFAHYGLLEPDYGYPVDGGVADRELVGYEGTDRLTVFIDALCALPLPEQMWVMPDDQ